MLFYRICLSLQDVILAAIACIDNVFSQLCWSFVYDQCYQIVIIIKRAASCSLFWRHPRRTSRMETNHSFGNYMIVKRLRHLLMDQERERESDFFWNKSINNLDCHFFDGNEFRFSNIRKTVSNNPTSSWSDKNLV